MSAIQSKLPHLKWAIKSRARNQASSLRLLELFDAYPQRWKTQRYSRAAQDLVSVAFSLWRAAFLADKESQRGEVFKAGRAFLERVIEDNAIGFTQDRAWRAWTFNYYTRNARWSLEHLHALFPKIASKYDTSIKLNATERWDYCQDLLDTAVKNFEKLFDGESLQKENKRARSARRETRKRQRKTVRGLTKGASANIP